MRAATTLIIALLLFFGLQGCSTARKTTAKEESHQEAAVIINQGSETHETGAAFFDQAIIDQILQRINITYDFERWDFDTSKDEGTPGDSTQQPAAFIYRSGESDKPPDVGRPKSFTKGTVTINAEGSQNRATQTNAGALVNKTDSTATAARLEKREDKKAETKEQKKASSMPTIYVIFLCIAGAVLIITGIRKKW